MRDDPELMKAYGWDDYPSDLAGEGNWVDLFLDETDDHPVGRLWINPDSGDIGLIALQHTNITYASKVALELREFAHHGVGPRLAYDYIKDDYYCGEEQTGELKEANVTLVTD
jgi:hypothetical protein